jgi:hypothetical protein
MIIKWMEGSDYVRVFLEIVSRLMNIEQKWNGIMRIRTE